MENTHPSIEWRQVAAILIQSSLYGKLIIASRKEVTDIIFSFIGLMQMRQNITLAEIAATLQAEQRELKWWQFRKRYSKKNEIMLVLLIRRTIEEIPVPQNLKEQAGL